MAISWAYCNRGDNRWEPSGLAWHIVIVLPEVGEAVGHLEGLAQLHQNTGITKEVPSLLSCNLQDRNLARQLIQQMSHWNVRHHVTVYVSRYARPGTVMGAGQEKVGKTTTRYLD